MYILFISGGELFIVFLIALLFFGSSAIPDIAKTLGKGMREFKKATDEIKKEFDEHTSDVTKDVKEISTTLNKDTTEIKTSLKKNLLDD